MSVYYSSIGKKILSSFLIGASFLAIVTIGIFWNNLNEAKGAPSSTPSGSVAVTGYAWSSNIGWIQFNPSYGGVFYNTSTGNLSGYAWSSNIGWIKFNELSSYYPLGGTGTIAKAVTSTGAVEGWARACAGTQSGDCTSMTSRTDGWDGWISLKGSSPSYGVSINYTTGEFTGYAWGSEVVGWISFNCSNTGTCGTSDYKVSILMNNVEGVDKTLTVNIYGEKWTNGTIAGGTVTGTNGFSCVGNKTTDSSIAVGKDKLLVTVPVTCTKDYTQNTKVDLSASPASDCPPGGCVLKKWDGACSGGNCSLTMDKNKTVDAYFKVSTGGKPPGTDGACGTAINTSWGDSGPTTNLCSSSGGNTAPVRSGSPWTWTCNGSNGGTNASCSASYDSGAANLTLNKTGSGTGNVKLYAWRNSFNDYGETVDSDFTDGEIAGLAKDWWFKMTTSPDSGSNFNSWTGCSATDPKGTTGSIGDCFVTMNTDKSVTVDFGSGGANCNNRTCDAGETYCNCPGDCTTVTSCGGGGDLKNTLTVNVGSGTVAVEADGILSFTCSNFATCSQPYSPSTSVTLTATETGGEPFTKWEGGGCSGSDSTCGPLIMNDNRTVYAYFNCSCAGSSCTSCIPTSSSSSVAPPIDGACGKANKKNTKKEPGSSELCKEGDASAVTETSDGWDWTCSGLNLGSDEICHAGKLEVIIQEI